MLKVSRSIMVAKRSFSSATSKTVGFIGLGNMGGHMAANLAKAGHNLVIYDLSHKATTDLATKHQCEVAESNIAFQNCEAVITMLPSSPHVRDVLTGRDDGLLKYLRPGAILIDASTIDPAVSRDMYHAANDVGTMFVDAPVSGGVLGAENGTLTFMVGGEACAFDAATPFLQCMGQNIVHCGGVGTGQAAKICNNMMLAISMIGAAETMALGVNLGIDAKLLAGILSTSTARCWSIDTYNPCPGVMDGVPASRGYEGGFGSSLMAKDLGLAMDAAQSTEAAVPLGALANEIYDKLKNDERFASKDFGVVFDYLSKKG